MMKPSTQIPMAPILRCLVRIVEDLLENHFVDDQSCLHSLITSSFRDLSKCANIINAQAPISRLPPDVLGLIFQVVQHNGKSYFKAPSIAEIAEAPLL
jgi:hypothetical protein